MLGGRAHAKLLPAIVPSALPEEGRLNGTSICPAPVHLAEDTRAGTK